MPVVSAVVGFVWIQPASQTSCTTYSPAFSPVNASSPSLSSAPPLAVTAVAAATVSPALTVLLLSRSFHSLIVTPLISGSVLVAQARRR